MVWDAACSGFLPETCGLFALSLNGAATERWMDEESREQGKGRPQSKLIAHREISFAAQVGYDSAFISGWLSFVDGN